MKTMDKNEETFGRKEKLALIKQVLEKAKKITDAGYGKVRFVEESK